MKQSTIRAIACVCVAAIALAGCAGSPSVRDAEAVSIRLYDHDDYDLNLITTNNPETTPGSTALQGAGATAGDCISQDNGQRIKDELVSFANAATGKVWEIVDE